MYEKHQKTTVIVICEHPNGALEPFHLSRPMLELTDLAYICVKNSITIPRFDAVPKGSKNMVDANNDPHNNVAKVMGFGGLLPFVGCAALMYSDKPSIAVLALFANAVYAAVILSFVGAVHWGLSMRADRSPYWYIWSIVPALLSWLAIVILEIRFSILALIIGFTLSWSVDRQAHIRGLIPSWYMTLRDILTAGAILSLLATAFAPAAG